MKLVDKHAEQPMNWSIEIDLKKFIAAHDYDPGHLEITHLESQRRYVVDTGRFEHIDDCEGGSRIRLHCFESEDLGPDEPQDLLVSDMHEGLGIDLFMGDDCEFEEWDMDDVHTAVLTTEGGYDHNIEIV